MKVFRNGLVTGLFLQLAIGPVFFFIANLTIQKSFFDGLAGVVAVTIVDYFYIALAIFGISKLLENKKVKKIFGIMSSIVLAIFGTIIVRGVVDIGISAQVISVSSNVFLSFVSVFILTISSPMTIVFYTSLFTAKAVECNYTKNELLVFGLGAGMATFMFMGIAVLVLSLIRGGIPLILTHVLNLIVGCLLIGYGAFRFVKVLQVR